LNTFARVPHLEPIIVDC